ncbi:Sec-independent protein translocase protein TatB [Salinicola halophilus]|uniref:Sec-independent protein translocase protein TatB n=1 Tax=Salinicola halophilus TaxID=184065 RepID=UPI000DA133A9
MFDIGFFELLLIGIVGLLILGPERLPVAARTAGLWIGKIRRSVNNVQREITAQLEAEELRQKVAEQQKKLDDGVNQVRRGVESTLSSPASGSRRSEETPTSETPTSETPTSEAPPREAPPREASSTETLTLQERVERDAAIDAASTGSSIPQPTSGTDRHASDAESPTEDKEPRDR